jgi:hypothetical protein
MQANLRQIFLDRNSHYENTVKVYFLYVHLLSGTLTKNNIGDEQWIRFHIPLFIQTLFLNTFQSI